MPLPLRRSSSRRAATGAAAGALACAALLAPSLAGAQSLRGSRASIDRMYRQAVSHDLTFYRTSRSATAALRTGHFERLAPTRHYKLKGVSHPYVVPAVRVFVERLAEQYHDACGEQLVVTSALRPSSRQPVNSTDRSVHPTGMAIDLRKPRGKCLTWLRTTLLALEEQGVLEATEERFPPHFHVAVFPNPYADYLGGAVRLATKAESSAQPRSLATAAPAASGATKPGGASRAATRRYEVRAGDTLWHLARRYNTTVTRIKSLNGLGSSRIRPGQKLLLPAGR